jgi:hypothetical protein
MRRLTESVSRNYRCFTRGRVAAQHFIEEGAFVFIFGHRQEALDAGNDYTGP